MKQFTELLEELKACSEAIEWAKGKSIQDVVSTCHRGDWLLWLAKRVDIDLMPLTLAKARCAKTVIHIMEDERSINAVNVAEQFGLGKATREELNAAAYDADAAASAAVYASASASAYASVAASAAVAASADAASSAVYAAAAAIGIVNPKQTADICRELLGDLIITKVKELLK